MIKQQERKHILYFSLVWLIVHLFLLLNNGIVQDGESIKYIDQANRFLLTGKFSSNNFIFYSLQILLIAAIIKMKVGFWLIIFIQFIFSWLATLSLYKLTSYLFEPLSAFIAVILFLLNIPFQEFNTFLQTESLFYSITIIMSSYLLRLQQFKLKHLILVFLLLVLVSFTRPTGLLFIPAVLVYLFYRHFNFISAAQKTLLAVIFGIIFLSILNVALGSGGEYDFILPFITENIICGVPAFNASGNVQSNGYDSSIYGLVSYIVNHFPQFLKLCWLRSIAFWSLLRSYYSLAHNIYLALLFYPIFALSTYQLISGYKKNKYAFIYFLSLVALTWLTVILTCDDWHNRFFLSISPYLILLASPVITKLGRKFIIVK